MALRKTVFISDPTTLDPKVAAVFTLERSGHIVAEFRDKTFQRDLEANGIFTTSEGTLHPSDGVTFFRALDYAWPNSSRIWVEATPEE